MYILKHQILFKFYKGADQLIARGGGWVFLKKKILPGNIGEKKLYLPMSP